MGSPLQQMIDKACGVTTEERRMMDQTKALLTTVQAAVDYVDANGDEAEGTREGRALSDAVRKLKAIGW